MHVFSRRGAELDVVRSYSRLVYCAGAGDWMEARGIARLALTSVFEILPTTLNWLSTTAREVTPSLFIKIRASLRGLSPLSMSPH